VVGSDVVGGWGPVVDGLESPEVVMGEVTVGEVETMVGGPTVGMGTVVSPPTAAASVEPEVAGVVTEAVGLRASVGSAPAVAVALSGLAEVGAPSADVGALALPVGDGGAAGPTGTVVVEPLVAEGAGRSAVAWRNEPPSLTLTSSTVAATMAIMVATTANHLQTRRASRSAGSTRSSISS
jgi:hypothetical protein